MNISVEYFGQLQHITGVREESVQIQEKCTVSCVVRMLAERYGERFRDFVYSAEGSLRKSLPIVVDDRQIGYSEDPSLHDAARVMILSPIAGG